MVNKNTTNQHKKEDLCGLTIFFHPRKDGSNFINLKEGLQEEQAKFPEHHNGKENSSRAYS